MGRVKRGPRRPWLHLPGALALLVLLTAACLWPAAAAPHSLPALPAAGPAQQPAAGPLLRLRGGAFDPLAGPALAAALPPAAAGEGPALQLVQFAAPIQARWYAALAAAGLQVVSYLPDYAYIVWGDDAALARLAAAAPVRWSGAYLPQYALHPALAAQLNSPGEVEVLVQVAASPAAAKTIAEIEARARAVFRAAAPVLTYFDLGVRVAAGDLAWLAALPGVVDVEPRPEYRKLDEIQGQIMAGNLNVAGTQPSGPGYLAWLQSRGFPTDPNAYPIVDVTDDGIDNGTGTPLHPDFYQFGSRANPNRLSYNRNWSSDPLPDGKDGHGNINAAIVAGYNNQNGSPYRDVNGYSLGLGINPYGRVAGSKVFRNGGAWSFAGSYTQLISTTYSLGGRISSNSWGAPTLGAYTADDQAYDALVRDAQPGSGVYAGNQPMIVVFSAGNAGSGSTTTTSPANAKNVIAVGAAEGYRPTWTDGCAVAPAGADNAQDIASFSSRGPAVDGRIKPDLVAPGTHIQGAASQDPGYNGSGVCDMYRPAGQTLYASSSGTSHAAPAVAGAASLLYNYYQAHYGQPPSPAMTKAYLINATRYLAGTGAGGNLPSKDQGYGEAQLGLAFDDAIRTVVDQSRLFTQTGDTYQVDGQIVDPSRPLRVTLAWTDAPGPASGAAYVNDLNLEVTAGGQTYRGNVFSGALSTTGGTADSKNNVESVFLPAGLVGPVTVRVLAANIAGDGVPGNGSPTDQDFALVIYNGGQTFGYLHGTVQAAGSAGALPGAAVHAVASGATYSTTVAADGTYNMTLVPGSYTAQAWKYGYALQSVPGVAISNNTITTQDFALAPTRPYVLSGCVTDLTTAAPLSATITVNGPFGDVIAHAAAPLPGGCYALTLYGGPSTVTADARLHAPSGAAVNLDGNQALNLALPATTTDGILWGYVINRVTGAAVSGANLQAGPGSATTQSQANGYYELQLPPATYAVTATAPFYGPLTLSGIRLPQSNLLRQDLALDQPQVSLTPAAGLNVTLEPDLQTGRSFTIGNSGRGVLQFSLVESDLGRQAAAAGGSARPLAPGLGSVPATGGPDPFGYTYLDNQVPAAAQYDWLDATGGTSLALGDDGNAVVTLPFLFQFYGAQATTLVVGNNGGIVFGDPAGQVTYSNEPLGTTTAANLIVPFWDDLSADHGGVYYQTFGFAPFRRFVVEWYQRPHWTAAGGAGAATLEAVLYEGSNNIKFQYQEVGFGNPSFDAGASATVGIRRTGNNYLQYSFNAAVLANGRAICFEYPGSPPCDPVAIPWLSVAPAGGVVAPGAGLPVQLTFDATGLAAPAVYRGELRLYSNDPAAQPYTAYPVTLTVAATHSIRLPWIGR